MSIEDSMRALIGDAEFDRHAAVFNAKERCDAARRRWREEQARPAVPGEPMVTMHTSNGQFQMPRRVADASREHLEALTELRRAQREQRRTFE